MVGTIIVSRCRVSCSHNLAVTGAKVRSSGALVAAQVQSSEVPCLWTLLRLAGRRTLATRPLSEYRYISTTWSVDRGNVRAISPITLFAKQQLNTAYPLNARDKMAGEEVTVSHQLASTTTVAVVIVVFISIALYNVVELITLTFTTFKKYNGLYFWSFLVCTCGIAFNAVGYLFNHFKLTSIPNVYATLILIGWCTMITGQSLVLYSRLHLILRNRKYLRMVLTMILVNATWLHVPVIILVYGSNSANPEPFLKPYSIYEKIQLTVFFVQECIISGIYLWKTVGLISMEKTIGNTNTKRIMAHLIIVNILIILLDVSILALEFSGKFDIQTAFKPWAYSVKLKLEFSILNKLRDLVQRPHAASSGYGHSTGHHQRGVPMETFAKPTNREHPVKFETSYSAHVVKGSMANRYENPGVLKTTEITIHTDERPDDDGTSLGRRNTEDAGCNSSSSSEVQFARSSRH